MTFTGVVENDTIKLPPGVHLPDGTAVTIEPRRPPVDLGPVRGPIPDFIAQQKAAGMTPFTKEETEAFDKWLRGETE